MVKRITYLLLAGVCAGLLGCKGDAVAGVAPTSVWSSKDAAPARIRHVAALDLAKAPTLAWKKAVFQRPKGTVITVVADKGTLCALWRARDEKVHMDSYQRVYVKGFRLSDGKEIWRYDQLSTFANPDTAALRNGRLFLAAETGLFVLDARTGKRLHHMKKDWTGGRYPDAMIVEPDGKKAHVADTSGALRCHTVKDGAELWKVTPFRSQSNYLAMCDGKLVYFGSYRGAGLVTLKARDGGILWRKDKYPRLSLFAKTGPLSPHCVAGTKVLQRVAVMPRYLDERVPSYLFAFDLGSGKPAWKSKLGKVIAWGGASKRLAADGERIYVVDSDQELVCLELKSGRRLWKTKKLAAAGAPIVSGTTIVIAAEKGLLRGLATKDGKSLWSIDLTKHGVKGAWRVIVSGGHIVVVALRGDSEMLLAFRPAKG